jgi:hypothetical protein
MCSTNSFAQTIIFKNTRLDSALLHLANNYDFKFAYDNELVSDYKVNCTLDLINLETQLKKQLSDCNLDFQIINDVYIIVPIQEIIRSYNLVGLVKDKETGETLPFAHIIDRNNEIFSLTNQDGYFSVIDINADSLRLFISYVGYIPSMFLIDLRKQNDLNVFYLSSKKNVIAEVVIQANDPTGITFQVSDDRVSLTTLNTSNVKSFPSMGESDALRLVQMMPGIKSTNESSADLIIRGGTMDQNLVLFDDFSLYHVDHFYGMVSSLNTKAIKHIQVYKGGFDARYGGRINSVVNIVGKTGNMVKPSIDFGINMLSANLAIETPLFKKGALFVSGRRSYTDIFQTPLFNQMFKSVENLENNSYFLLDTLGVNPPNIAPEFYFYDINTKLTYNITSKDNISVSYFKSLDNLTRDESVYGNLFTNNDILKNNGLSFRWGRQWNEKHYTKVLLSQSEFFNDFVSAEKFELEFNDDITYKIQNTNKLKEKSFKLNSEYKLTERVAFDYGYEYTKHEIHYLLKYSSDDFVDIGNDVDNNGNLHSAYFQTRLNDIKNFGFSLGLRTNYYKQTDKFYFEPRLNLTYKIADGFGLKAAYGIYRQYLTKVYTGDEYSTSKSLWFISNDLDIPVSKSKHYIAGLRYSKNDFLIDIEYFKKDVSGMVKYVLNFSESVEAGDTNYIFYDTESSFNPGTSKIQGVDILVSKDFSKFHTWISYTLSENHNKYKLINNDNSFYSINDQRHEFKFAGIKTVKNFKIAFSWIYGSGFVYSDPYYLTDNPDFIETNKKLPDYHKLDISFIYDYRFKFFSGDIGVSILNIYNRENKRQQESIPFIDGGNTYYDLTSIDLTGRAISAHFNIKF